jgi:methyl-accepting chemotaxis protein
MMSSSSLDLTRIPLGPRLGLLMGLGIGAVLLSFLAFVTFSLRQSEQNLEHHGRLLARTVGSQATMDLMVDDQVALKDKLDPILADESVLAAGFYDDDGQLVAARRVEDVLPFDAGRVAGGTARRWVDTDAHGEVLIVTSEIRQGGSRVGSVLTVLPTGAVQAQRQTSYVLVGGVLVLVVLLGAFVMRQLRRTVEQPVQELRNAARAVENGALDVRVAANQADEIGELAASFNAMVAASQQKNEALQEQSAQAEQAREEAEALREEAEAEQAYLREQFDRISAVLAAVEQGDLTRRLSVDQDDAVGGLMRQVNAMIDQLSALIREVEAASTQLSNAAKTTAATVEQLSAGAQTQAERTTEVAAAVEEMSSTVAASSRHAERSNESAQRAADLVADGEAVFQQTAAGMEEIADLVTTSADKVEELGTASAEIGEIVQVIEDIADQTNLLALNAAIEAARAGEEGKGFAVVAEEVRALAERTTSATQKIADMVAQIQARTDEVVAAMAQGTDKVEQGLSLTDEAADAFDQIVDAIDEMVAMIDEIAAATQQQSATTRQIAQNVDSISGVADEVSLSATDLASTAEDMSEQAAALQGLIERFSVDDAAAPAPSADGTRAQDPAPATSHPTRGIAP